MYPVFRLVYETSAPGSRHAVWFPLGNLLIDLILLRSAWMCLTGRVTWRGTNYSADATGKEQHSMANEPSESSQVAS
jgi:hypothetical protein